MRLRLTVAYDGSAFSGWQSQAHGRAVQDAIEKAFRSLCPGRTIVHGAGRTDAGVHAIGQCAHADVPDGRLTPQGWLRALNANLPNQARIMDARAVAPGFHARFSARRKIYRYSIWNGPVLPPLEINRAWHVHQDLDGNLLKQACALFVGHHDFSAFSARRAMHPADTKRTLSAARVVRRGEKITLTFEGGGFLYKMVRMLTAAAVRHACGKTDLDDLRRRLQTGGPRLSHVAPACGLCLLRVVY